MWETSDLIKASFAKGRSQHRLATIGVRGGEPGGQTLSIVSDINYYSLRVRSPF